MEIESTTPRKRQAAALSVASNTSLVVGKLVVGIWTGSVAVLSEAVHSAMDLLAAVIALVAVSLSGRPPDQDHEHGHGKIEDLSGAVEALLIFGAVLFIGYESIEKLIHGNVVKQAYLGSVVMGLSAAINTAVAWHLQRVGRATESNALLADAAHLRTDVYTSLGVLVGLSAVQYTGLQWLDPVAALAVGLLIVNEAWRIVRRSIGELLDESLPQHEREMIERIIHEARIPFHALRSRRSGPTRVIDLHLEVDPKATAEQIHEVCDRIEARIEAALPGTQVLIHPEPTVELDSTRPVRCGVESILEQHRDLYLDYSDICVHEDAEGLRIAVRVRLRGRTTVSEFQRISEHLTWHVQRQMPGAALYIHPDPAATTESRCPPSPT